MFILGKWLYFKEYNFFSLHSFSPLLYLQGSHSFFFAFDKFWNVLLLFFDHGGELLRQRARFLLLLLGMDEGSFEVLQLSRQSIAILFHLTSLRGRGREVKHLKNHVAWSLYQIKHIYSLTEMVGGFKSKKTPQEFYRRKVWTKNK